MDKSQKSAEIENLKTRLANANLAVLTDYRGLDVTALTELRRTLTAGNHFFKVVKNRLLKIAVKGTPFESLTSHLTGPTAVTLASKDPIGPAKAISDFLKKEEKLQFKAGVFDGKELSAKQLQALASMPSKEELVARMLGSLNAPARNLASVLIQVPRQLVTVLNAVKEQKEKAA